MEYGFLSLVPPLLTIALALITKNVFLSLFIGIMTGSFVLNGFAPLASINAGLYSIVDSMSQGNTIIIASCLIVGAVIHLMERSGGIEGFVNVIVKKMGMIKTKRGANLFTWLLGLAVFTSGSLSCMVTGAVSRPVNDSMKVPHEKSAFIVHATSTPWCVLFPFSGWLASMAGYLISGGVSEAESVSMLFSSLPFNFYCIMAIVLCFLVSVLQKDVGPMVAAEKRAAETGLLDDARHSAKAEVEVKTSGVKARACNLLAPIGVLIVVMFATLLITGKGNIMNGAGMQALLWSVVASLLTIIIMTVIQKVFTMEEAISELHAVIEAVLQSDDKILVRAEKLIRAIQQTSGRESRYVKLYNEITKLSDEKQVRYYADRIEGISYEAYAGFLKRAKEEGDIRSDLDERMFAFFFDSLLMTLQFSYTCDYYRERFKVYCGDDIFDNDEKVVQELLKFLESAFTFSHDDVKKLEKSD